MADPTLYEILRDMRKESEDRHIEVVERLSALETNIANLKDLDDRVKHLEGWRNKMAGALVAINMLFGAAVTWWAKKGH